MFLLKIFDSWEIKCFFCLEKGGNTIGTPGPLQFDIINLGLALGFISIYMTHRHVSQKQVVDMS